MINNKECPGFSLVELLITLVIIAVLVAIAYPSYTSHIINARRSTGAAALLDLASRLEQHYSENNSYVGATLENLGIKNNDFYRFEISNVSDVDFLVKAIPMGVQAEKDKCGSLVLDNLGNESVGGSKDATSCWGAS